MSFSLKNSKKIVKRLQIQLYFLTLNVCNNILNVLQNFYGDFPLRNIWTLLISQNISMFPLQLGIQYLFPY